MKSDLDHQTEVQVELTSILEKENLNTNKYDRPNHTENGLVSFDDGLVCNDYLSTQANGSRFSRWVERIENSIHEFLTKHSRRIKIGVYSVLLTVYFLYFAYCMNHRYDDEGSVILIVVTLFLSIKVLFKVLESRGIRVGLPKSLYSCLGSVRGRRFRRKFRCVPAVLSSITIVAYLAFYVFPENTNNLQSFFGLALMILLCFIFSKKPSKVNFQPVFWSFVIQFVLAFFTLRTQIGYDMFKWLGDFMQTVFNFSETGSEFVVGKDFRTWGLALSASGVIIFSNALIFLLNQWGVIEFIVLKLGGFLAFCLGTGPVESVVAAANIFISLTEAPLMIRPYLPSVTKSELHTIITCGIASTSGGIMALFMMMGAPPNHLLTACVISAPASLAVSKLLYPEDERARLESQSKIRMKDDSQTGSFSAFSDGAVMAVSLCVGAWSNMLAFVSMINLLDSLVGWLGNRAGIDGLTFSTMCAYVLFPLVYAMGSDASDCFKAGELLGIKLFATPFISYQQLGFLIKNREVFEDYLSTSNNTAWRWVENDIFLEGSNTTLVGGVLSVRSEVISTYSMCGLSAFPAIGMTFGTLIPLCPARKHDIADVMIRAFVAGNVACFATGCIVGVLYTPDLA